ncbi:MAG: vancomycin high temperature exclusion protein [Anaerolineae bacterium]
MRKRAWIASVIALILCSPLLLRLGVALRFAPRTHAPHAVQEPRYAAVVLGARVYHNGAPRAMLADRIGAAVDLYHAGHVDVVVMSGDGREPSYAEPGAMARYAMQRGVPPEDIIVDGGGTRTYDSCYRLGHVLGIDSAYLVSQNFH